MVMAFVILVCWAGGMPCKMPSKISAKSSLAAVLSHAWVATESASHMRMVACAASTSRGSCAVRLGSWAEVAWGMRPGAAGRPGYWEFHPLGQRLWSLSTQYLSLGVATLRKLVRSFCLHPAVWGDASLHKCAGMLSRGKASQHMGSGSSAKAMWRKSVAWRR